MNLSIVSRRNDKGLYVGYPLMRRGFDLNVLACPRCGGRMRLLATIEDPQVIRTILAHLGLPTEVPSLSPPRLPPARAADLFADMPA